ncbi:ABC transporter permease [soil metagenome]
MHSVLHRARTRLGPLVASIGIAAGFIAAWEAIAAFGVLRADQLPRATEVMSSLISISAEPETWLAVGITLLTAGLGLLVSAGLGILVGVALGVSEFARKSTAVLLEAFKSIPAIAVLPLAILTFGSTPRMSIFLIFFAGFWPLVIQVIYGVRAIDPTTFDTARALGVGKVRLFIEIILPAASPYIATGLRVATASALSLTVIGQMVGGAPGIGREILMARNGGLDMLPTMFAFIVIAGIIGSIVMAALGWLERRLMFWHESQQGAGHGTRRALAASS